MHRRLRGIVALLAASVPVLRAAPPSMQRMSVEMGVQSQNEAHHVNRDVAAARNLQLDQLFGFGALLGDNSTACPEECPLCQCNATEQDAGCLLEKSVEACASGALEGCYTGLLASVSQALPGLLPEDFDFLGLCDVECDKPSEEVATQFREICRICDIFACCQECPSERAAECFPEDVEVTPPGWEPATCTSGAAGLVGRWLMLLTVPSMLLLV